MGFRDIALPLAAKGVPCTPVLPNSKKAFMPDWPTSATVDPQQIIQWDEQFPNYNGAAVATGKPGGVWFLEVDSPDVMKRLQEETGQEVPDTFRVRSRPGRGHFYWRQTAASLAMGNISQSYVKAGDWSARVENQYVVAPGSIHPHSQQPYIALREEPIIECPDWVINWLISQKAEKKSANSATEVIPKDAHGLIPHGFIHGWMLTQAGKLRNVGLGVELIESALLKLVHENCAPPIDEAKVKQMARSICSSFPAGQNTDLILTQAPTAPVAAELEAPPVFESEPYPKFPRYVMQGTSVYEHFVKPVCDVNSRVDYFMWLPAMTILMNYVGPKVKIKDGLSPRPFRGSMYSVIIGKKGKSNKSSSVNDAMAYFNYCGILQHAGRDVKNAEGRVLSFTPASTEFLGIQMQRSVCKNALLYYDELSKLVGKAHIESSSLNSDLLLMYESGKFENGVKSTKESFSHDPDTYCVSLIACTTDGKFAELWSQLAGSDTGLDDRFFFVLQPEKLPEPKLQKYVNTVMGSIETKKLIDKALAKVEYAFEDASPLEELVQIENRYANRAEKWALAIAIDLGLDEIDGECIERAKDIVKYEIAVKRYLKSYEATTREGQIQMDIRRVLEMNSGVLSRRDLMRKLNAARHGTSLWGQAYGGLIKSQIIREEGTTPVIVRLLQKRETDEDE